MSADDKPPFADFPEEPDPLTPLFVEEEEEEDEPASPEEQAALQSAVQMAVEAFFAEPFPRKPYALAPVDSYRTPEFTDYIIHKDVETERQCIIIFDSIVDAFQVAEEYKKATGKEAEPIDCDLDKLEERFYLKFYRANGVIAILSQEDYKQHIGSRHED